MKYFFQITFCLLAVLFSPAGALALSLDEAFEQLKSYDEGQNNSALVVIEQQVGRISGHSEQSQQLATRLAALLAKPQTSHSAKLFVCQQLRVIGGGAQVPMLVKLLLDPKTTDMALLALQARPETIVTEALVESLDQLQGNSLISVLNSLGERGESSTIKSVSRFLTNSNAKVATAAARSLGKIGTPEAADMLLATKPPLSLYDEFRDAHLLSAQRLVSNGQMEQAETIYHRYLSNDQPENVRAAALTGLVEAVDTKALPQLAGVLDSKEDLLPHLAIELIRNLGTSESAALLKARLTNAEGSRRILLLGALAENGDQTALNELSQLARSKDRTIRKEGANEIRRLTWASRDTALLTRIGELANEPEVTVEPLTTPPYPGSVTIQRRKDIAAGLTKGDKLLAYLDCGTEVEVEERGVRIRQMNGATWWYAGSEKTAAGAFGSVAFEARRLEFEFNGLDPNKHYALGFSWWDYDANGRVQSMHCVGGEPQKSTEVLTKTKLPAYVRAKQGPATGQLPIDSKLIAKGKVRIAFQKHSGPNATVSELWLIETQPGSASATRAILNGSALAARPQAKVDLTPPTEGTKVLIVTGIDYPGHPWQQTAPILKELLEQDPRLQVRIVEDPDALASPKLMEWDTVIIHFMDWEIPGPGTQARKNLSKFVSSGNGLVLTHFACGAWDGNEWPEFTRLAGQVWDPKLRGHDPHGKFRVEIADPNHPITQGMQSFETIDEIYTCLAGDTPIHIVAKATSKVDEKVYPMAFVLNYGKGQQFRKPPSSPFLSISL